MAKVSKLRGCVQATRGRAYHFPQAPPPHPPPPSPPPQGTGDLQIMSRLISRAP